MPIYNYRCDKCNINLRKIIKYKDRNTVSCPKCGRKLDFLLPDLNKDSVAVYDMVDKDRGKQVIRDVNKIMRERAKIHRQDQEAGEFVEKNGGMRAVMAGYIDPEKKKVIK